MVPEVIMQKNNNLRPMFQSEQKDDGHEDEEFQCGCFLWCLALFGLEV